MSISDRLDEIQARALAEAGLLAPAPLREEWGAEMDHPIPDMPPSTTKARDLEQARWQVEHNPKVATGRIMHRYVSDWMPVDSDEGDMEAEVLAATAALRAVLDLHQTKRNGYCDHCTAIAEAGCGIEAPCPTVCTIATALGEDTP